MVFSTIRIAGRSHRGPEWQVEQSRGDLVSRPWRLSHRDLQASSQRNWPAVWALHAEIPH